MKEATVLRLAKKYTDEAMATKYRNTKIKPSMIDRIFREDVTIYDEESGKLLILFRKGVLGSDHADAFYDNIIDFVRKRPSNSRGNTTGETWEAGKASMVHSNIVGYFDRLSIRQNYMLKKHGIKLDTDARETLFNVEYPEKFKKMVPYVRDIDRLYKEYVPAAYKKQIAKAKQTHFRIGDTSFSTVTINLNYETFIHVDKKDDPDGFGNLTVIERGKYSGGETCLPQWGIGVDVRQGDVLFMDVHEWHGNLPLKKHTKDAERLSTVCYFMPRIWAQTRHKSLKSLKNSMAKLRSLRADVRKKANATLKAHPGM